ncbi:MAG: N-acetylmuramoyl-L-alanine amidase, partial [Frankiales bacterium]|nr:N-acetylmuramoyl-L-alanine amidase [Frankiales bacterium]
LPAQAAAAPHDVGGWRTVGPGAPRASARTTADTPSTFSVSYTGIDPGAQAAVGRATAVLAAALDSAVPVTLRVDAAPLPDGVPAVAAPGTYAVRDRNGAYDVTDTLYPVALANALAGRDVDPGGADVVLTLSSTAPLSTTAEPAPANAYDLTSVVLHALLPALGLTTTLRVDDVGLGRWGVPGDIPPLPVVADRLLVTAGTPEAEGSVPLLSRVNGSKELATVLAGPVLWDGRAARAASRGSRPLLGSDLVHDHVSPVVLPPAAVPAGSPDRLLVPSLGLGETVRTVGPVALGLLADLGWAVPSLPGARFTPVAPRRLLDTRTGLGQGGVRRLLGPGGVLDLQVAGGGTGVPLDAVAVVLNVTGVAPSRSTDLRAYPSPRTPEALPQVSSLNLGRGTTRANAVTVSPGRDGKVRLRNSAGTVSVLVDLQGYYAASGQTLFHPRNPVRILDTRTSGIRALGPGQVLDLPVAGVWGVPASARAVVLGVTGVGATRPTDVRVYPTPTSGTAVPDVSTLNLRPGAPVAGLAVVQVGRDGWVRLRNAAGRTAVLVDLSGWFDSSSDGGLGFRPVAPQRVFDSRLSGSPRLLPGGVRDVAVSGRGGVPAGARATVLNLTGIAPSRSTDLRAYPAPVDGARTAVPTISSLNLAAGQTSAGAALVEDGSHGRVRVRNQSGSVAVAVDVTGWFGP